MSGEPVELPQDELVPMREDTIFDMASVSKLFTVVATLQQVDKGLIDFDAPVVHYIPEFVRNDERKGTVIVRQLLTHTWTARPAMRASSPPPAIWRSSPR